MTDLIDYKVFVAVVESKGVSLAATKLHMSAPAISKRLNKLEHNLGVSLFQRAHKKLTLTNEGISFYPNCKRILADIDGIEADLRTNQGQLSGTLNISLSKALLGSNIFEALSQFSNQHPQLNYNLQFSDTQVDLVDSDIDFAFRLGDIRSSTSYVAYPLCQTKLLALATPTYVNTSGSPKCFDNMLNSKLVMMNAFKSSNALKTFFNERCISIEKLSLHIVDDISAVKQLIQSHMGIGLLLNISVENELKTNQFIKVLEHEKLPKKAIITRVYKNSMAIKTR